MGTKSLKQSLRQAARPALISIQPRYVEKILAGEKVLEFRRRWAAQPVDALVIYSSSPEQRIVAVAKVRTLHHGSPTHLWKLAQEKGGGVTRSELYSYFSDKHQGYAIELSWVLKGKSKIDPKSLFGTFRPPQSFHYMDADDYAKVFRALEATP